MRAFILLVAALCLAFSFKFKGLQRRFRTSRLRDGFLQPDVPEKDLSNPSQMKTPNSIDVSDLGISMEDLNTPIKEIVAESAGQSQRGYYSWIESTDKMSCRWRHPGTNGQPHSAVRVDFTETTIAVFIFNYNVWTGITKGKMVPHECSFTSEEAPEGVRQYMNMGYVREFRAKAITFLLSCSIITISLHITFILILIQTLTHLLD